MFFRPLRDGGHKLTLSPILPSDWSPEKKHRSWMRWLEPAWPAFRPSIMERLITTANDRDHRFW